MARSTTTWLPGESGNPGGRPKAVEAIRRLAQEKSAEAFTVVESLMVGAEKDSVRLAAALAILKVAGAMSEGGREVTVNMPPKATDQPPGKLLAMVKSVTTKPSTGSGDTGS